MTQTLILIFAWKNSTQLFRVVTWIYSEVPSRSYNVIFCRIDPEPLVTLGVPVECPFHSNRMCCMTKTNIPIWTNSSRVMVWLMVAKTLKFHYLILIILVLLLRTVITYNVIKVPSLINKFLASGIYKEGMIVKRITVICRLQYVTILMS